MSHSNEGQFPEDLEAVAQRLRAGRAQPDPLQLDQIKHRAMVHARSRRERQTFMRSRVATVLTILGLIGGTGGAVAIASHGAHSGPNGGAASGQYKPGKGCGDRNHTHTGPSPRAHHRSCRH